MSNQFSYELDERQIRIMLRDGEAENDPAAWNRFEQLAQPDIRPKQSSLGPRFNISLSRSVLVPAVFVVLIGGLSATLFSFVDFKKKDVTVTKNTLEQKSLSTPASTEVKPEKTVSTAPEKTISAPAENITATPGPTVQPPAMTQNDTKSTIQKTEPKAVETAPAKTVTPPVVTASKASTSPQVLTATNSNTTHQPVMKRKAKKVVSEEIPTINTSSTNLNQESQEPELELH